MAKTSVGLQPAFAASTAITQVQWQKPALHHCRKANALGANLIRLFDSNSLMLFMIRFSSVCPSIDRIGQHGEASGIAVFGWNVPVMRTGRHRTHQERRLQRVQNRAVPLEKRGATWR